MPRGIAHSTFLAWSPDDQDKALAWVALQNATCSACGTREEEWDPARGGDRHAYVADARRCAGCEALAQAQRQMNAEHPDELGIRLGLVPNTDDEEEGAP